MVLWQSKPWAHVAFAGIGITWVSFSMSAAICGGLQILVPGYLKGRIYE